MSAVTTNGGGSAEAVREDRFLAPLDALRGLLAVYVIAGHARWLLWAGHQHWIQERHDWMSTALVYASAGLRYGHLAVLVFFTLSGFFIHLRVAQSLARTGSWPWETRRYLARRAHRMIPPYGLALVLTVLCDAVGRHWAPELYAGRTGDALLDASLGGGGYGPGSVVPAVLLVPGTLGFHFGSNGPLWSIAFEVFYYALYPVWLQVRRRGAGWGYGVGFGVALAAAIAPSAGVVSSMVSHFGVWLAGAGLAEVVARGGASKRRGFVPAAGVAGLAAFGALHFRVPPAGAVVLSAILGMGVVAAFIGLPGWVREGRALRMLEGVGLRSYSLYLCHFPLLVLVAAGWMSRHGMRPLHGWLAVAGGAMAFGLAWLCFELGERHFLHARLRLVPAGSPGLERGRA